VDNLATDLEGNGSTLNSALEHVSELVSTFADKDDQLAAIVDHFDDFTATLVTREQQLGEVLDAFGAASQVLADERSDLQRLLASLASLAENSFDLVAEHAAGLRRDVATITRLVEGVNVNLDSVAALLDSGPNLVTGLENAYNPSARALNLRNNLTPALQQALNIVLEGLLPGSGITVPCIPLAGTVCEGGLLDGLLPVSTGEPVTASLPTATARSPIDDILGLLASPGQLEPERPSRSTASKVAGAAGAVGGFLRDAAGGMVGIG
jgi:ABC-type transporter Mla subunit MlaD